MTNNQSENLDNRDQDLKETLNQLAGDNLDALNDFVNMQTMAFTLFQHEARRLSHHLGKEHPRVKQLEENIESSRNIIRGLNVERETARIRTADVPKEGALVHGRVTDRAGRGIPGFSVCAENETGKPLRAFGCAETDATGYYAVALDHPAIVKLKGIQVYLTVGPTPDKIIHHQKKPIDLKPNSQSIQNMAFDRDILRSKVRPEPHSPKKPSRQPGEKSKPESNKEGEKQPETKVKDKAKIDIGELKGIGPRTAEQLRKVSVSDIEAFIRTDEAKLKKILRNVNIRKMKHEAAIMLRKARESADDSK